VYVRPQATGVCGLKLQVYAALSYECMRLKKERERERETHTHTHTHTHLTACGRPIAPRKKKMEKKNAPENCWLHKSGMRDMASGCMASGWKPPNNMSIFVLVY
jgi:hypothetical protein